MTSTRQPSSVDTVEHYVWGGSCDGWHLLKQPDLSVIQERVPPGACEVRHHHFKARQFFFVLTGKATIEFDDAKIAFSAGQGVHVSPGVMHRFCNHSDEEVVFLVISAPSTREDRLNA